MVKKTSLTHLLFNKMRREIKNNIKQFLALILIAGLAVTLYVGLSANAKSLQNRVDKLYDAGNIADIFVYSTDVNDEDMEYLSNIDGVEKVEKRFSLDECIVYRNTGTLMIVPDDNTICVPSELEGTRGVVIDSMFAELNNEFDANIDIGNTIKIALPYSIESLISNNAFGEKILAFADGFVKEGKSNFLREKLTFYPEITGLMKHPETVEREMSNGTCLLDESTFRYLFKQKFIDSFDESVAMAFYEEFANISFFDQYLIKVKSGYNVDKINKEVYRYFNPNSYDDQTYIISTRYWGDYSNSNSDITSNIYHLKIKNGNIFINDSRYEVAKVNGEYFELKKINSDDKLILHFIDNGVELMTNRYQLISQLDKLDTNSFVASLTKSNLPSNAVMEQDIYQAKQLCVVFPIIFFIVAALVNLTSLSQTIYRSRQEIGTMKALGISKSRILFYFITLGVSLSLIGAILGSIVGPLIIIPILNIKYSILYNLPNLEFVYPLDSILFCIGIFVALSALVSFAVTYSEIKMNPVESMRPKANKALKNSHLNDKKNISSIRLSLRMAFRNIISKKSRMFMVIFGVMGCTALTVAGFGILDTIYYGIDMDLYDTYNADLTISYETDKEKEAYEFLLNNDKVEYIQQTQTKVLQVQGKTKAKDTYLNLFEKNDMYSSYDILRHIDDGIAMANSVAKELDLKVGDEVNFIYLGKSYKSILQYTYESSYWLGLYAFSDNFKDFDFKPSGCFLNLKEGYNPDAFIEELRAVEQDNKLFGNINSVNTIHQAVDNIVSSVKMMCNTVKVFAVLLAVVVTYNLAALNFVERRRDIATFKVLGLNAFEIGLSLVFEILFLTIIGVIFGLFLGYPLLYLIMSINETSLLHYIYHISISTFAISTLISLGTAILVNSYLAFMASKVDAVSALKSVE